MTRKQILPYVGRMEQLASIRRYIVDDGKGRGMRAFEVSNSSGFAFTVYPDRGLDIGPASYNGKSLTWMTRNGLVAPAFYDASGTEWLRSWQGGLVTTCGWMNVGNPGETQTGNEGLHGRADHTPSEEVNACAYWNDTDEYILEITGKIVHSRVFGENLVTSRTIRTRYGYAGVELVDRTENCGCETLPLMQLYHMNFGWPLVSETAELGAVSHAVTPRNAEAAKGLAEWWTMPPPQAGFAEQVLYHDLPADEEELCHIAVTNPRFFGNAQQALRLSFRKSELPYLIQWRQAGCGDYVLGLEPANCYPIGQSDFAKTGLIRHIEPGQTVETRIKVEVTEVGQRPECGF